MSTLALSLFLSMVLTTLHSLYRERVYVIDTFVYYVPYRVDTVMAHEAK
jgi:hypothetical protein